MLSMAGIPMRAKRPRSPSTEPDRASPSTVRPITKSTGKRKPGVSHEENEIHFACLFCKHKSRLWSTYDACGGWHSGNIDTVVRHHLLAKHREINDNLNVDDPKRINPHNFEELRKWRRSVRLEKKHGDALWTRAYMILFNIDESNKEFVPSPYFSNVLADKAVDEISMHIQHRGLEDPALFNTDTLRFLAKSDQLKMQRDVQKAHIRERYGREIRNLKGRRETELRLADEQCARELGELHEPYKAQLQAPRQPVNEEDLTYISSAPLQSIGSSAEATSVLHPVSHSRANLPIPPPDMDTATHDALPPGAFNFSLPSDSGYRENWNEPHASPYASRLASDFLLDLEGPSMRESVGHPVGHMMSADDYDLGRS